MKYDQVFYHGVVKTQPFRARESGDNALMRHGKDLATIGTPTNNVEHSAEALGDQVMREIQAAKAAKSKKRP